MTAESRQQSRLQSRLQSGVFAVTAELVPPLTADAAAVLAKAAPLLGKVDGLNVTDAAGARPALGSLAAAALLRQAGFDPILQMTCRDRNRIALIGDLLGAAALGIANVLALHGDDPKSGEFPEAPGVYDLDSRGLMELMRQLRDEGRLPSGRAIAAPPAFFIGAADSPLDPPADWRPAGLLAKIEAGADFAQTQFCFDLGLVRRYLARLADFGIPERLKILVGVGPLASARQAEWMNANLFGVAVPEAAIARLAAAADPKAEGRRLCVELIHGLKDIPGVAGVHIMAPQQPLDAIAQVIDDAGLGEI